MCGMTNTTGSGEGTMDMTVGRINQLTGQTGQSVTLTMRSTLKQLDNVTAQLSAALRREEVLREALTFAESRLWHDDDGGKGNCALCMARAALAACDEGRE